MTGPTRGHGLLEAFLSERRTRLATRHLSLKEDESVLDIGCGTDPLFLRSAGAGGRFGIERFAPAVAHDSVNIVIADAAAGPFLPFRDESFHTVTMLAVLEHLASRMVPRLLKDIHRVLKPGGTLFLTTPPPRTDRLLKIFAKMKLVSAEEIEEHDHAYTTDELRHLIGSSPFPRGSSVVGTFELGMNLWAKAAKQGNA